MAMQRMKLSQFRYDVPEELVAQYPLDNRDDSRLMIINRETGTFEHRMFKDVVDLLTKATRLANNARLPSGDEQGKDWCRHRRACSRAEP